jgi:hypothetical protein
VSGGLEGGATPLATETEDREGFRGDWGNLKISFELSSTYNTCEAFWYFRCCEGGEKQHTAVAPGVFYACSAYVWYEGQIDSVGLGFRWYDVNGDTIGTNYRYISTSSLTAEQWELISDTCTAPVSPDTAYSCIISINAFTIGDTVGVDTGSVWIDDVQLYEALKWKTYYPDSVHITFGDSVSESAGSLGADDAQCFTIGAVDTQSAWRTDWYGQVRIDELRQYVKRLWVGYDGHYSVGERNQKIYLMNWSAEPDTWDILCATDTSGSCLNKIRQADITHGWSTANASEIQDYIDSDGDIWFRVMGKDESSTFNCFLDLIRITAQYKSQ